MMVENYCKGNEEIGKEADKRWCKIRKNTHQRSAKLSVNWQRKMADLCRVVADGWNSGK